MGLFVALKGSMCLWVCEHVPSVVSLCYMIKQLKGGVLLLLILVCKHIPFTQAVLLKIRCYIDSTLDLSFFSCSNGSCFNEAMRCLYDYHFIASSFVLFIGISNSQQLKTLASGTGHLLWRTLMGKCWLRLIVTGGVSALRSALYFLAFNSIYNALILIQYLLSLPTRLGILVLHDKVICTFKTIVLEISLNFLSYSGLYSEISDLDSAVISGFLLISLYYFWL